MRWKKMENNENIEKKLIILEALEKAEPEKNLVVTAIKTLQEENDIKQFYTEYIEYLEQNKVKDSKQLAIKNIGHVVGYFSPETINKWYKILPELENEKNDFEGLPLTNRLMKELKEKTGKKPGNCIAFAIDTLQNEEDIKQFYNEYVTYATNIGKENPEQFVKGNISCALGYYSKSDEKAINWKKILSLSGDEYKK
jgi:hypothetical protein